MTREHRPGRAELRRLYRTSRSIPAVASELGVAYETARQWLIDAGIKLGSRGRPSKAASKLDTSQLQRAYGSGATLAELGEKFAVSPTTIRKRLIDSGVELRPRRGWNY